MSNRQYRLFDNNTVDRYSARFSGLFDLEDDDAASVGIDDQLVFVVVARVDGASFKKTPTGDLQRVNQLGVRAIRISEGASRAQLIRMFNLTDLQEQLPFDDEEETGEILEALVP